MSLSCPICSDNIENDELITLPCNCFVCYRCISDWIKTQSESHLNNLGDVIKCPCEKGHPDISVTLIISELPLMYKNQVYDILFENYLSNEKSIRKCPNNKCHYAGIIECCDHKDEPLECLKCKMKWKDSTQMHSRKVLKLIKFLESIMNFMWEIIFTKECPFCQILIEKNEGCDRVNCKRCSSTFCWSCLKSTTDHDIVKCKVIFFIKTFLTGLFCYHVCYLLGVFHLLFWLVENIFVGLFANIALALAALVFKLVSENSSSLTTFGVLLPSSIGITLGILLYIFNKGYESLIFIGLEASIYLLYKLQKKVKGSKNLISILKTVNS